MAFTRSVAGLPDHFPGSFGAPNATIFGPPGASLVRFVRRILRPDRKVISEQLHYERGVFVAVIVEGIQLCNSRVERILCQCSCFVFLLTDLVVADGEV